MCRCGQASPGELTCRTIRKLEWKRKDALAGDRRGANEEANLPLAGNYDGLGLGRGSSQLHDDDDFRRSGNGNHSVHDNAQLAVIGVGIVRMKMSDLGYGQHRQQKQAEDCHGRQKAGRDATSGAISGAAFAAENCGESRHGPVNPCDLQLYSTESLQKFGRHGCREVAPKLQFGDFALKKTLAGRERLN
jgi:hypothetical protein